MAGTYSKRFFRRNARDGLVVPVLDGNHDLRGHWSDTIGLIRKALDAGAVKQDANSVLWDISGNCESPLYFHKKAVPNETRAAPRSFKRYVESTYANTIHLDIYVKCRKCPTCLRMRQSHWTYRAKSEIALAPRTWFGTLTLRPQEHYNALMHGRAYMRSRSVEPDADVDELQLRHKVISKWITLWFKRLRKSGIHFRYLLVMEIHKSGLPHYHLLIHEVLGQEPVRYSDLQTWPHGFSSWKLVTDDGKGKTAHYISKYLSKAAEARVRASVGYGRTSLDIDTNGKPF